MRIAHFHTNTIFSSWTNLAIPATLRAMGHEVLQGPIPTDAHGSVIHPRNQRVYAAIAAIMPAWRELTKCDVIFLLGPEYLHLWLEALYGRQRWRKLKALRVGFYLESAQREDQSFRYADSDLHNLSDIHFYPSAEDAERFHGHCSLPSVDTKMFKPCPLMDQNGHACNESCRHRVLRAKKYEAAFLGSLYGKRIEFLRKLDPYLRGTRFFAGSIRVRDLSGERQRDWAELLVENLHQIKIHVGLPSNNTRIMVARPLETMAAGTFLITYRTDDSPFADGVHCRYYDPEKPEELADMIRYYLLHEAEREEIAAAGCREVHTNYSLEKQLGKVLEIAQRGQ